MADQLSEGGSRSERPKGTFQMTKEPEVNVVFVTGGKKEA